MTTEKDAVIEHQKKQLRNLNETINSLRFELEKQEHQFFYLVEKLEIDISEIYSIKKEANNKFEDLNS